MSATATATGVVERMLGHAVAGRWDRLHEVLDPDFEIVEPASLPYGGTHRGVEGYVALMRRIGALFVLRFEPAEVRAVDATTVLVRMHVTFTARAGGRGVRLLVAEVLSVAGDRVTRSEVYVSDTAALLRTLLHAA